MEPLTKDFRRTTLRPRHRPTVRALADAMFSPDGEVSDARLDAFVDQVDRFVSPASKTLRFGLMLMLDVLQATPLFFGRFRSFTALSREEQRLHLERLERSRVPQLPMIVVAYRTILTMLFYENESELRALGYPGPERKRYLRLPLSRTL